LIWLLRPDQLSVIEAMMSPKPEPALSLVVEPGTETVGITLLVIAELFMTLVLMETVSEQLQSAGQFCVLTIHTGFQRVSVNKGKWKTALDGKGTAIPGKNDPVPGGIGKRKRPLTDCRDLLPMFVECLSRDLHREIGTKPK
jgi:hypothetical protein